MGDENFIPTKNVAGPPVFYPQGKKKIYKACYDSYFVILQLRRFVYKEQGGREGA